MKAIPIYVGNEANYCHMNHSTILRNYPFLCLLYRFACYGFLILQNVSWLFC